MKKSTQIMERAFVGLVTGLAIGCTSVAVGDLEPLPVAVTNNAVAAVERDGAAFAYSMLGIGASKTWDAITTRAFELDVATGTWREIAAVPGDQGRIAGVAVAVGTRIYLFGGYTVAESGDEVSMPNVDVYDAKSGTWSRGTDMPIPVDDAVAGVYRDRWVYLVSGWSMTDNVPEVQIYDTVDDRWTPATPIPGTPVFGHAGGLTGDTIVYCDGAYKGPEGSKPRYRATDECWLGHIDPTDMSAIDWARIPGHPGTSRYRAAAGAANLERRIYFAGGTDNPYNIDGIGYDGSPSEPVAMTFAWDVDSASWVVVDDQVNAPTMDHRGLLVIGGQRLTIGGMEAGQVVTRRVMTR